MTETLTREISEQEAANFRARFPIFDHTNYLNSCSLGPLSYDGIEALNQYQSDWARYGAPAWWKVWLPKLDEAREAFARLIGAQTHEVTISHSVSSALSSIASTFDYGSRKTVVCADLDFPTIPYQWLVREPAGVQVHFARSRDRIHVPLESYEHAMNPDVGLIATSHAFFATGYIQPVRKLADLAHENGAKIIVDGYHAVGTFPVDVKALDVDFYVGGTLKWLIGGPGLTFIYVREELIPDLSPQISGWFASGDQFAFNAQEHTLAPTAGRLQLGTPSVPTAYSGVAGMRMIEEAGPERIQSRISTLTERVIERARQSGYGIRSPEVAEARGGIVMLELDAPQETVDKLGDRNFTVDYRPGLLRVSPHFFNTMEDVHRLMDAIDDIQAPS
jgi:kynureninase